MDCHANGVTGVISIILIHFYPLAFHAVVLQFETAIKKMHSKRPDFFSAYIFFRMQQKQNGTKKKVCHGSKKVPFRPFLSSPPGRKEEGMGREEKESFDEKRGNESVAIVFPFYGKGEEDKRATRACKIPEKRFRATGLKQSV